MVFVLNTFPLLFQTSITSVLESIYFIHFQV